MDAVHNIDTIDPYVCRQYGKKYSLENIAPVYEKFFGDVFKSIHRL